MRTIIVYDSWYGNTEQVAKAIAAVAAETHQVTILNLHAAEAREPEIDLRNYDLLIVGSPTHGGMATPVMHNWLNSLPPPQLHELSVAAFDTRVPAQWVKIIGFASKRMAAFLEKRGVTLVALPMGFYVRGKTGPLKNGERERAKAWTRQLLQTMAIMHDHSLGVA